MVHLHLQMMWKQCSTSVDNQPRSVRQACVISSQLYLRGIRPVQYDGSMQRAEPGPSAILLLSFNGKGLGDGIAIRTIMKTRLLSLIIRSGKAGSRLKSGSFLSSYSTNCPSSISLRIHTLFLKHNSLFMGCDFTHLQRALMKRCHSLSPCLCIQNGNYIFSNSDYFKLPAWQRYTP